MKLTPATSLPLKVFLPVFAALSLGISTVSNAQALPFERTETREPCDNFSATKRPMFGDLHVHTSYSFDSYVSSQRNDPWAAYRYAKGEPITLPDANANQNVKAQIHRPLDFTAVTDHAEFLGPIELCTQDSSKLVYWFPACMASRNELFPVQLLAANYWVKLGVVGEGGEGVCVFEGHSRNCVCFILEEIETGGCSLLITTGISRCETTEGGEILAISGVFDIESAGAGPVQPNIVKGDGDLGQT